MVLNIFQSNKLRNVLLKKPLPGNNIGSDIIVVMKMDITPQKVAMVNCFMIMK